MTKEPVCVLGAGTMGRGIAQVAAQAGHPVRLRDINQQVLAAAMASIQATLDKGVALGKMTAPDAAATLARFTSHTDLAEATRGSKWVIEAVPEDVALKQRVLGDAEAVLGADAILATNTSSL